MPRTASIREFIPGKSDRVFLAGQTGSGKTTLAEVLLRSRKYVVVYDLKGTLNWRGYVVVRTLAKVMDSDPEVTPRIIYRPTIHETNEETADQFFRWIYTRENTTVYIDELALMAVGNRYPFYYGACLRQGREKNIEVWSASQRPKDIPIIAMSEAEHVFSFFVKMPQDQQRVYEITGIPPEQIAALPKRYFFYAPQDGKFRGPQTLLLTARAASDIKTTSTAVSV